MAQFQTVGSSFSPEIQFAGPPLSFQWSWSDGSSSTDAPVALVDFGFPGSRLQNFYVNPAETLTSINLGFDGMDGGWTNSFALRPAQGVAAVSFPAGPLTGLRLWASSYNPITNTLDFSGFNSLRDIECFHCANLEHVVVNDLPALERICFENNFLRELDLSGNPNLEDVRAALNAFPGVTMGRGTGPKIWHFCLRDNPQITQPFQSFMTNFYSLREFWAWNANQSGALTFVSTNLTDVEVFFNRYTYADFSGQSQLEICQVNNNQLTNLVLSGCAKLQRLDAQNNRLPTAVLDEVLTTLAGFSDVQNVNLAGNPELASSVGLAAYTNLVQKGAYVNLDWPSPSAPTIRIQLESVPSGLMVDVDGHSVRTPHTFNWPGGSEHSINARGPQPVGGQTYDFSGWSDAGALAHLIAPKSNTTYRARFSTPFTPVQGTYTGVFFETNGVQQQSSGGVSLTITDRGTLSGFLRLGSSRLRLAGQLDLAGHATLTSSSISVSLIVDLTGATDRVSGSVGNGIWVASLDAVLAGFDLKQNPAGDFAGTYTLAVSGINSFSGVSGPPDGNGWGRLTVDKSGKASLQGMMGEGSAFTFTSPISHNGEIPFYLPLYGGRGSVLGVIELGDDGSNDVTGALNWIKPALASKVYPEGFTNSDRRIIGSRFVAPHPKNRALELTNAIVAFEGGNLSAAVERSVILGSDNKTTPIPGPDKLSLVISASKGTFNGKYSSAAAALPFQGVVLQRQQTGFGFFTTPNRTGGVKILPSP